MTTILKITHRNGNPFSWVRGCYEIKEIEGEKYITLKGGLSFYEPDFKKIIEKLANLDLTEENILKFVKQYGLPGTYYFYIETGSYERRVEFSEPLNDPPLLKWEKKFGAQGPGGLPYLSITNGFNSRNSGTRGELTNIPKTKIDEWLKEDMQLWDAYREPLEYTRSAIRELIQAVEYLIKGKYHPRLKLKIELDGNKMIAPVTSLLEGCYSYLIWYVGHGSKIKQCVGYEKYNCGTCQYGKRFFWQKGTLQLYGKNDCRYYQNERAARYRKGETNKRKK